MGVQCNTCPPRSLRNYPQGERNTARTKINSASPKLPEDPLAGMATLDAEAVVDVAATEDAMAVVATVVGRPSPSEAWILPTLHVIFPITKLTPAAMSGTDMTVEKSLPD